MLYPTPPSSSFQEDIKPSNYPYVYMGEINEDHYSQEILDRYKDVKKSGSKKTRLHYRTYDWASNKYYIELKSRNNGFDVYSTTMIGYNKVEEWKRDTGKKYFFLFGFLDGFYEWELNATNFNEIGGMNAVKTSTFQPKEELYSTFNTQKRHLYIPIRKLIKISDKGCLVPDELVFKSRYTSSGVCLIKL